MSHTEQEKQFRDLRKYSRDLEIAGKIMLACGAWAIMRTYAELFLGTTIATEYMNYEIAELSPAVRLAFLVLVILVFCIITFLLHLTAGLGAVREGQGRKQGYLYMIFTVIVMVSSVWSLAVKTGDILLFIRHSLIEILVIVDGIDILFSGICVKRLRKELEV